MSGNGLTKIALVGIEASSGSNEKYRWESFKWEQSAEGTNIQDFDIWVFYVPTCPDTINRQNSLFEGITLKYVYTALEHNTDIFVLGDPRKDVTVQGAKKPFLNWTGYHFKWSTLAGDSITHCAGSNETYIWAYIRELRRWNYALEAYYPVHDFDLGTPHGKLSKVSFANVITNRLNQGISFTMQYIYHTIVHGTIIFVPENLDLQHPRDAFLQQAFGITLAEQQPKWLESMVAPDQSALDARLTELKAQIANLQTQQAETSAVRVTARECLNTLYQIGEALEIAVDAMLRSLGATVLANLTENECDRYLSIVVDGQEHLAVVEIKGTSKKHFDLKGMRQVKDWRDNAFLEKNMDYRALFIGNSDTKNPPKDRPNPFTQQWVDGIKKFNISCITTPVLYEVYCRKCAGTLDIEKFWKLLLETDGIFELSMLDADAGAN